MVNKIACLYDRGVYNQAEKTDAKQTRFSAQVRSRIWKKNMACACKQMFLPAVWKMLKVNKDKEITDKTKNPEKEWTL